MLILCLLHIVFIVNAYLNPSLTIMQCACEFDLCVLLLLLLLSCCCCCPANQRLADMNSELAKSQEHARRFQELLAVERRKQKGLRVRQLNASEKCPMYFFS